MRTLFLFPIAALALVITGASQPASLATKSVKITASAFSPANVTINTGDTVTWTNSDTKNHQVIANNGSFASPTLGAGKKYSHLFTTAGTFNYHDALHPKVKGKVVVKGSPPEVTIGATQPILTFGQGTHIAGAVSTKQAGETVTVWAQPYGQVSAILIATLLTGVDGAWDLPVKPTTLTAYEAHWKSSVSAKIQVAMRPKVIFAANKRVGFVRVKSDRSLAGRKVYVQRLTRFKEWVKFRRVFLRSGSKKRFFLHLTGGRYALRVFVSMNAVGAGYQDGYSNVVRVRKKR
jgi:plastocyanin